MDPLVRSSAVDHVVGIFSRESLSGALAATHRAGFGPHTRVLDGTRSDVDGQLARLGLRIVDGEAPAPDAVLIVVNAPGRIPVVAELFQQLGALPVLYASRGVSEVHVQAPVDVRVPDLRLPQEASNAAEP